MGTWSHQNAYRKRRYLAQTMGRSVLAEQVRHNSQGRRTCMATVAGSQTKRCKQPPTIGADYCRFHGGASAQVKHMATIRHSLRVSHDWVQANMSKLGDKLQVSKRDPREVLLEQVHNAAAMAAATREMAEQIEVDDLLNDKSDGHFEAQERQRLFQQWNGQALKAAKTAMDMGIDEALVRLAEQNARQMVAALKIVLQSDVLGFTPQQIAIAQKLMANELRGLVATLGESKTQTLHVDGEEISYNPAMDQFTAGLKAPARSAESIRHQGIRTHGREDRREARRLALTSPPGSGDGNE